MGHSPYFEKHRPKNKDYFKLFNFFSFSPHYTVLHLNYVNKAMFILNLILKRSSFGIELYKLSAALDNVDQLLPPEISHSFYWSTVMILLFPLCILYDHLSSFCPLSDYGYLKTFYF